MGELVKRQSNEEFAKRLSEAMFKRGVGSTELAREVGTHRTSVFYWLKGKTRPNPDTLKRIADFLRVTPLWLKTGNEESPGATVTPEAGCRNPEKVEIATYRMEFPQAEGSPDFVWVREDGVRATYSRSFFEDISIDPKNCKRVKVVGNFMAPLIRSGDYVLIAEGEPVSDGVYAISSGNALQVKRLVRMLSGDLVITCDAAGYSTETIKSDSVNEIIRVHGRVIERSGRI